MVNVTCAPNTSWPLKVPLYESSHEASTIATVKILFLSDLIGGLYLTCPCSSRAFISSVVFSVTPDAKNPVTEFNREENHGSKITLSYSLFKSIYTEWFLVKSCGTFRYSSSSHSNKKLPPSQVKA